MDMARTQTMETYFLVFLITFLLIPADSKLNSENYREIRQKRHACENTPTDVNGKTSCKGKLIFEDNFDGPQIDNRRWSPDRQIAGFPDYDFAWFTDDESNLFIREGVLFLKPTLVKSENNFLTEGTLDLRKKGCTSSQEEDCFQKAWLYNILPPVQSARIRSKGKFSFKYGVIEVRCKLPEGFWLYPQIYLEPASNVYGNISGRMVLAQSRGNLRLTTEDGEDVGSRRLIGGLEFSFKEPARSFMMRSKDLPVGEFWNTDFHVFQFKWTPSGAFLEVDKKPLGEFRPPAQGFGSISVAGPAEAEAWNKGDRMAPFDQEFYITLGMGVGGQHAFPDGVKSGDIVKPWKNSDVKMKLHFARDKPMWKDTWAWDDAALQVDYVKVWAL